MPSGHVVQSIKNALEGWLKWIRLVALLTSLSVVVGLGFTILAVNRKQILDNLSGQITQKQQDLNGKIAENSRLQTANATEEQQNGRLTQERDKLNTAKNGLVQTNAGLQTSVNNLSAERTTLQSQAKSLQKQKTGLDHQLIKVRGAVQQSQTDITGNQASILAGQFLLEHAFHPPNGKQRDNRDEQALFLAVQGVSLQQKFHTMSSEAVTNGMIDALSALDYSYRFTGHGEIAIDGIGAGTQRMRLTRNDGQMLTSSKDGEHLLWNWDRPMERRPLPEFKGSSQKRDFRRRALCRAHDGGGWAEYLFTFGWTDYRPGAGREQTGLFRSDRRFE